MIVSMASRCPELKLHSASIAATTSSERRVNPSAFRRTS
jgi:hypothetical protein